MAALISVSIGRVIAVCGAGYALYGIALPWAQVTLFGALPVSLPGYFYVLGGIALTGAICAIPLLRYPLFVIACGILVVYVSALAQVQIPHAVRGQLIGAQVAFSPINRLLDQFHIPNVTVGAYGGKDEAFLGAGPGQTVIGGWIVLIGGLVALPGDPILRWGYLTFGSRKCRACQARWPLRREARHCPNCGIPTETGKGRCTACGEAMVANDRFCIRCGTPADIHRDS